jgi:hypothetical protein
MFSMRNEGVMTFCRTSVVIAFLFGLTSGFAQAEGQVVQYSAKFLCGVPLPPDHQVSPGIYNTSINIHNPNLQRSASASLVSVPIAFKKKAVISLAEGTTPLPPSEFMNDTLNADFAEEVDCDIIRHLLFPNPQSPSPQFMEGFVVILVSAVDNPRVPINELDVVGVYTGQPLSSAGVTPNQVSLEIVPITPRFIAGPGTAVDLPDLVPLSDSNGSFCRITDSKPPKLIVTIKNQGTGPAGASTTEVSFGVFRKVSLPTPALTSGAFVDFLVDVPRNCLLGLGSRFCPTKIAVDSLQQVTESNKANNIAAVKCP